MAEEINENTLAWIAHHVFSEQEPLAPNKIKKKFADIGVEIQLFSIFGNLVPEIIKRGWARLLVKKVEDLSKNMCAEFQLEEATVTRTNYIDDVASHAAYIIRDLITRKAQEIEEKIKQNKELEEREKNREIHIGFSGGNTMRLVFQKLIYFLSEPDYRFPTDNEKKTVVCHALVAGFDNEAPGADPNSFFTFLDDCKTPFAKKFVLLHAPAFVQTAQMDEIFNSPAIEQAHQSAEHLDLIVTSAAAFNDDHSQLAKYYRDYDKEVYASLEKDCVGDMLWLPVNSDGPMDVSSHKYQPVTLLQLGQLPAHIKDNKTKVLLVVGPCADPINPCPVSKARILQAILNLQSSDKRGNDKYVTHLVTDKVTASEILGGAASKDEKKLDILASVAHQIFSDPETELDKETKEKLDDIGIHVGKSKPFRIIVPELNKENWILPLAPMGNPLTRRIDLKKFNLDELRVTRTNYIDDVASHAAYIIRDLITRKAQEIEEKIKQNKELEEREKNREIHIGFSGGNTMRLVFQKLIRFLSEPDYNFPKDWTVFCHALVAGFDNEAPGTNPNSFFTYMYDRSKTPFAKKFVLLHAPAFVQTAQMDEIFNSPAIEQAHQSTEHLDLIVTSAAAFNDDHSQLAKYYRQYDKKVYERLKQDGCVGDMLWLPVNSDGPIDLSSYEYQPMTLLRTKDTKPGLDLEGLRYRIWRHTKVLLVVGPCADPIDPCPVSKARILQAILSLQQLKKSYNKYITHLVVDNITAMEFLELQGKSSEAISASS